MPSRLLSYLLISYLESTEPGVVGIGNLLGFIDYIPNPGVTGDPTHPPFVLKQIQLSRLGDLFTKPQQLLQTLYQWGTPGFDAAQLMPRLSTALSLLGTSAQVVDGPPIGVNSTFVNFQLNTASTPPGLTATSVEALPGGIDLTLPLSDIWSVHVTASATVSGGLQATVTPPANVTLHPTAALTAQLESDLVAKGTDSSHPIILVGQTGGSRLQADSFTFAMGVAINWDSGSNTAIAEPQLQVAVTGGKVVIDTSNADGFLATVLSGFMSRRLRSKATWAPDTGIHIDRRRAARDRSAAASQPRAGHAAYALPRGRRQRRRHSRSRSRPRSASRSARFRPRSIASGVKGLLSFPDHGGNLGPRISPSASSRPTGWGSPSTPASSPAAATSSSIPTRADTPACWTVAWPRSSRSKSSPCWTRSCPTARSGFSFLLIITFDFPPIQLGFGFTLNGVGGLGGVNRTMNTDALHAGFRAHTLNNILFPPDPIANAPQIISNIESFFPPAEGRYMFGPMLEIGWGTPTLITLAVGVILEVPDPDPPGVAWADRRRPARRPTWR